MKKNIKLILTLLLTGSVLAGCGTQGETGPQGPKGDQGEVGQQGPKGEDGKDGNNGKDGVSIVSVTLESTTGLVDTYKITFSDGTSKTFELKNGENGKSAYELYCEEHEDYTGTLQDWIIEFYSKDETDYSKYDDFLFSEVTYGGIVGYAANYIGTNSVVSFPDSFKMKPVLFATMEESPCSPLVDKYNELPKLEEIYFPSSIKVVNITDSVSTRFDASEVVSHFEASIDSFKAPYYPLDIYFEGGSLQDYRETNLRKFFPFSNIYVKSGYTYELKVNRVDQLFDFMNNYYDNEGGIKEQLLNVMGGSFDFYRFGNFELEFPKKFDVNFDGYDITLPLNFIDIEGLEECPGVTFEDNVLKSDTSKFGVYVARSFTAYIDLGLGPNARLNGVSFNLFKTATKIKVGDSNELNIADGVKTEIKEIELKAGRNIVSVYNETKPMACDLPFKIIGGLTDDVTVDEQYKTLNVDADGTYVARFNLSTFEIELAPSVLAFEAKNLIISGFKADAGFPGAKGYVLDYKELYCPNIRTIKVNENDYSVDLKYEFAVEDAVENANTEHPTMFYNEELDPDNINCINAGITVKYSIANDFISGSFEYMVNIFNFYPGLNVEININALSQKSLMLDPGSSLDDFKWKLNEVELPDNAEITFGINSCIAGLYLSNESEGELKNNIIKLADGGLYNVVVNLSNSTVNFEKSDGHYTQEARRGFFNELKRDEANVYIDPDFSKNTIVLFDNISLKNINKSFDFTDSNLNPISADVEILEKEGSYYSVDEWDSSYEISVKSSFGGFQIDSFDVGVSVNICVPGYFLKLENVVFQCIFRHYPKSFTIEGNNYTSFEDNIITFENIHLNEGKNCVSIDHCDENGAPFKLGSGEGAVMSFNNNTLNVPYEGIYTLTFNLNTMLISSERIE